MLNLLTICLFAFCCGLAHAEDGCEPGLRADEIAAEDTFTVTPAIAKYFAGKDVIAILGSSRIANDSPFYDLARTIAVRLGNFGYTILTGGGPGLMDAANRGARATRARSVGFEVNTPWPRHSTEHIDKLFIFDDLQLRKRTLMSLAQAIVILPGGIGSLDELFTITGAIYSGQLSPRPIILVGKDFWQPLLDYLKSTLVEKYRTARPGDFAFIRLVESAEAVLKIVQAD